MTGDRHDATAREQRDLSLGRALDELDVPDYPDGFLASVWERLDGEDSRPLEGPPAATAHGLCLRRVVARRRLVLGLAAALVVAIAVAVSLVGLPGGEKAGLGPPQTAAARLLSRMVYAMSRAHTLTGVLIQSEYGAAGKLEDRRSGPFAVRDDGSWRLQLDDSGSGGASADGAAPQSVVTGYDAARHVHWWFFFDPRLPRTQGNGILLHRSDGRELAGESLLVSGFAAGVRAALAEGEPAIAVKELTFGGRPSWQAVVPALPAASPAPSAASPGARLSEEVIVDQKTGLPLRVTQWGVDGGRTVWEMRELRIDAVLPADEFASAIPAGVPVRVSDQGLRFLSLAQGRRLVGFTVPVPTQVPDGFRLEAVIVHGGENIVNGSPVQDPLRSWVDEVWRRGLDTFRVQVSTVGGSQSQIDASLARTFASAPAPRSAKLPGGLFGGRTAFTAVGPNLGNANMGDFGPVLTVVGKGVMVSMFGDLTRRELLDAASSLQD